ncbi:hypothetical protein GCM10027321_45120 [Massilia terrae]
MLVAGMLALGGCGLTFTGPKIVAHVEDRSYTPAPQPSRTVEAGGPGGAAQVVTAADPVGGAWWQSFRSPALDALVEQALRSSPTLKQANARLAQARENYNALAGATEWPRADLALDASRQKISSAAIAGGSFLGSRTIPPFSLYDARVNVSYSLDLFGANRAARQALAEQAEYQRFELEAARLTLAGNVVTTVIRHAALAAQIDLSERMVAIRERQLRIAQGRLAAGGIAESDLLAQRILLQQSRSSIPALRTQLAQASHLLAVLLDRTPANAPDTPALDAIALPSELPVSIPARLAGRRPDIRAAAALMYQADANLGVATANLFPQITLTGSAGAEGTKVSEMASVWALGAGLTQPLFHGGELQAKRRAAEAAHSATFWAYRQTVLEGLQQVADALRALELDAEELAAREQARRDAASASGIARKRFEAGGISELAALEAERQELQASLDRTRAQAQRLLDSAALFQALGAPVSGAR